MSNNAFVARTCIVGVVVMYEYNMVLYFLEAGNLNGSSADICSDMAGLSSIAARVNCLTLDVARDPVLLPFPPLLALLAAILALSMTTTPILPFKACYIIMHKVYWGLNLQRSTIQGK